MNIPVAHIQGGEVTGSIDESIRHAMSKFAHIHFPATVEAKKRLIRLGENPVHIHVVGCPSIDVLKKTPHVPLSELEDFFSIDFREPVILMIQHPVTTEYGSSLDQIRETIRAINDSRVQVVALLPNNDAGFSSIVKEVKTSRFKWFPSLPTLKFINLYRNVSAIVGNSSSGIHEAATFGIPAVNIGNRQQGRMHSFNVLDVPHDEARIKEAIEKALYDRKFRARVRKIRNPYGDGDSAGKIVKILREVSLDGLIQKKFYE